MRSVRLLFIGLNNWITWLRKVRVPPPNLLLLIPHCLRRSQCKRYAGSLCDRCGQCDMDGLLRISDRYGILCNVASGGRQALEYVRRPEVRAVVAVACEKELMEGIRASFPKPVLAVPNLCPAGSCRNTRVDLIHVESGVRRSLRLPDLD